MQIPISPKSAFAPLRYQSTRPWWKELGKLAAKCSMSDMAKRSKIIMNDLGPAVMKIVRERLGVQDPRVFQNESGNIQIFGGFVAYGRIIYEMSDTLVDNLAITDFDDVTLEDLELPNSIVYLHFGDHPVLNIDGTQYEGMFVGWHESERLLSVQAVRHLAYTKKPLHFRNEDSIESLPVFFVSKNETIKSAIQASRQKLEDQQRIAMQQLEQIKSQYKGFDLDTRGFLHDIQSLPSETEYRRIVSLALSSLCFLAARPEDVNEGWPIDTPKELVERATMDSQAGKRTSAHRQLENDGYVLVRYVGAEFSQSTDAVRYFRKGDSQADLERTMATHPRKGFFRKQACGPGYSMRKIKYIAPTIVNPGGKLGPGHIFEVQ